VTINTCGSDTADFSVSCIATWVGERLPAYPGAKKVLILCDGGGSNGSRNRLFKANLQDLADRTGLSFQVCHYPPGASKWNPVEHRLFSAISKSTRAISLTSAERFAMLVRETTTRTGLKVECRIDRTKYVKGVKVGKERFDAINIERAPFHPEWNYTIHPKGFDWKKNSSLKC